MSGVEKWLVMLFIILEGTNSWVHCIVPISHSCKDALRGVQWP